MTSTNWPVILLLTVLALACAWIYRDFAQDDAFITYRYARNIVNGHGFVYNVQEPVLGTTTPLYTLVLASVAKVSSQDIRAISHLISTLSLWGSGVLLYYLGRDGAVRVHTAIADKSTWPSQATDDQNALGVRRRWAAWFSHYEIPGQWPEPLPIGRLQAASVAAIFVSNPLLISAIGMETFFLIALLLAALRTYLNSGFKATGILLGLLMLTRYETVLFVGLLGIDFLIRRRRLPMWLFSTGAVFIIWIVFAWLTFGHIIPQSAVAKLIEEEGYPFALGAVIWWRVYATQTAWYYGFGVLALLGGYVGLRYKGQARAYRLILAWTVLYFIAASLVAGSFSWYYGPLIPGFSILLGWGIEFLVRLFVRILAQFHLKAYLLTILPSALYVVFVLGVIGLQVSSWTQSWVNYRGQIIDTRFESYRQVSDWLNNHADAGVSLATGEIGILGYYTDLRIIDLRALVTPELIPQLNQGRTAILHRAIELYRPDYLVTDEAVLIEALQRYEDYEPIQSFSDRTYVLYRRR